MNAIKKVFIKYPLMGFALVAVSGLALAQEASERPAASKKIEKITAELIERTGMSDVLIEKVVVTKDADGNPILDAEGNPVVVRTVVSAQVKQSDLTENKNLTIKLSDTELTLPRGKVEVNPAAALENLVTKGEAIAVATPQLSKEALAKAERDAYKGQSSQETGCYMNYGGCGGGYYGMGYGPYMYGYGYSTGYVGYGYPGAYGYGGAYGYSYGYAYGYGGAYYGYQSYGYYGQPWGAYNVYVNPYYGQGYCGGYGGGYGGGPYVSHYGY